MAFDPTGQVGLPQDLTYELLTPSQSGVRADIAEVVVAVNPAKPTDPPRAFWRGLNGGLSWGQVGAGTTPFVKDTTLGTWKPNYGSNGQIAYPLEERFIGSNFGQPTHVL